MKIKKQILGVSSLSNNWLIIFIVFVGAVLRFWNYTAMPYMHDELSSLSRLGYNSLREVIRNGVMIGDTHPAGVQVYLYFWTMLGGNSEMWVKLPFVLSGVLSILIVYKIGCLYFDKGSALLAATMVATTQFFIMYSQIARPYSSGLLLTLLMVYFWSLYFFKKRKFKYLLFFILFAALSSYNHHFSLLFASIVGISGLFLIKSKKELLIYILSGFSIFLLYVPHLNIFFFQLNKGGVGGWLAKPEATFLFDFINYMFHYSFWVWGAVIIIVAFLTLKKGKKVTLKNDTLKRVLFTIWFFTPIIIGYLYSVFVNPIVQYSMLIFSAPYFFILIFSFHKEVKDHLIYAIILLLIIVNVSTLVFERKHYEVFYNQPYEELFKTAVVENKGTDVFIVDDCIPYYHDFYFDKYQNQANYYTKRNAEKEISDFRKIISEIEEHTIVCHAITGEEYQIIKQYFPNLISLKKGFTYEIYTFSKIDNNKPYFEEERIAGTKMEAGTSAWGKLDIIYDSINVSYCAEVRSEKEWGPSITFNILDVAPDETGFIDFMADIKFKTPEDINDVLIVMNINDGGETLFWNARNILDYKPVHGKYEKYFFSVDLQTALGTKRISNEAELKIYIWNKSKTNFFINEIFVAKRPGNNIRYALYEPIN